MHEYAVTESILEIVESEANKAGAERVESIKVVIGELSTYVDESIDFYFQSLAKGSVAEDAQLVFEKIKAEATCLDCGADFHPEKIYYSCPNCHSYVFELKKGQELFIESLEVK